MNQSGFLRMEVSLRGAVCHYCWKSYNILLKVNNNAIVQRAMSISILLGFVKSSLIMSTLVRSLATLEKDVEGVACIHLARMCDYEF